MTGLEFHEDAIHVREKSLVVRNRIIAVAKRTFLEKNYQAVSTHVVAELAQVQQSLIRYHFGNKLGLWKACIDELFGQFRCDLARRIAADAELDEVLFFENLIRHVPVWPMENFSYLRQKISELNRENQEILGWGRSTAI